MVSVGRFLLLAMLFSAAYVQWPLYSLNQNTYFLHGLAQAGVGHLTDDFLVQTRDPFPVFSFLVEVTYRLNQNLFYLFYVLLLGIYVCSLLGIASQLFQTGRSRVRTLVFLAVLFVVHAGVFRSRIGWLYSGVAGQYVLGTVLQPSVFGVLLIASIYFYLRKKPFYAVALLALAATVHSTYLLGAASLTLAYMLVTLKEENDRKKALFIGLTAFVLVLPVVLFAYSSFAPTSPEAWDTAQRILVDFRFPHHANPSYWLDATALAQMTVILLALILVRKKVLFWLLAVPAAVGVGLTILQVLSGSRSLAMLFPWRVSVFLVPIATAILTAWGVDSVWPYWQRTLKRNGGRVLFALGLALIAVSVFSGAVLTLAQVSAREASAAAPMMQFVRDHSDAGDMFLIPLEMEDFRLYTGVPVFVDFKSHPYRDTEVIEWYDRLRQVEAVYEAEDGEACDMIEMLAATYGVTHIVFVSGEYQGGCPILELWYADAVYEIYRIIL